VLRFVMPLRRSISCRRLGSMVNPILTFIFMGSLVLCGYLVYYEEFINLIPLIILVIL
jgi:hypothetical protein